MSPKITQDILESYVFCRSKGYLQWTGEDGTPSDYLNSPFALQRSQKLNFLGVL
jgi:hypothetical protein